MKSTLLLLLAIGLSASSFAQTAAPGQPASAAETKAKPKPSGISIDFPGGSVASLISTISSSGDVSINVIGEKEALEVELPAFSVRNVDGPSLIDALVPFMKPHGFAIQRTGSNVWYVEKAAVDNNVYRSSMVVPVNMTPYLDAQSIDDIVAAIRLAWELNSPRQGQAIELKFHPPTKLLLISGSPEAIKVATNVIGSLSRSSVPPKATHEPAPDKK